MGRHVLHLQGAIQRKPEARGRALLVSLMLLVLLLFGSIATCLHIQQSLFKRFYALRHIAESIDGILQGVKCILPIEPCLFIVRNINTPCTIRFCNLSFNVNQTLLYAQPCLDALQGHCVWIRYSFRE